MAARKFYQINQYIRAEKVRVIDKEGKQIGIMPTVKALNQAKNQGLDLVEIVPKAQPPVCKIVDFKGFLYQQKKKRLDGQKRKRQAELKQIRIGLFIEENDLQRIIKKARDFLKNENRVKFTIFLAGRMVTKKELGFNLFEKIKDRLSKAAKISQEPQLKGKILEMTLKPK